MCGNGCVTKEAIDPTLEAISRFIKEGKQARSIRLGELVVDDGEEETLDTLEREFLTQRNYDLLRKLNRARLLFDVQHKRERLSSKPLHIQLEHSTYCNAACIMCDHAIAGNKGSKHLDYRLLEELRSLLPYVEVVVLHGNGEPLLHPDIEQILDFYASYGTKVSLNTNLSLLNETLAKTLASICSKLHISCDGVNKEQYEAIRQGLSFDRFLCNVDLVNQVAPRLTKELDVVIMRQNVLSMPDFVDFASEHGFSTVSFSELGVNGVIGNSFDSPQQFLEIALYQSAIAKKRGAELGVEVLIPYADDYTKKVEAPSPKRIAEHQRTVRFPAKEQWEKLKRDNPGFTNKIAVGLIGDEDFRAIENCTYHGICEYPFGKTYIDLEGNVSFCCLTSRKVVGKIGEQGSLLDIWNGEEYRRMRRLFYDRELPYVCRGCNFLNQNSLAFLNRAY